MKCLGFAVLAMALLAGSARAEVAIRNMDGSLPLPRFSDACAKEFLEKYQLQQVGNFLAKLEGDNVTLYSTEGKSIAGENRLDCKSFGANDLVKIGKSEKHGNVKTFAASILADDNKKPADRQLPVACKAQLSAYGNGEMRRQWAQYMVKGLDPNFQKELDNYFVQRSKLRKTLSEMRPADLKLRFEDMELSPYRSEFMSRTYLSTKGKKCEQTKVGDTCLGAYRKVFNLDKIWNSGESKKSSIDTAIDSAE